MNKKIFLIFILVFLLFFSSKSLAIEKKDQNTISLFVFHSKSCHFCKEELAFLDSIKDDYPFLKIYEFEVTENFKNQNIFKKIVKKYSLSGGVPVTFFNDEPIVGFQKTKIKDSLNYCLENECRNDYINNLLGLKSSEKNKKINNEVKIEELSNKENSEDHQDHKKVLIFGNEICLDESSSTCALGVILGLADGINPCMFSVLLFLLTYLLAIGSRKRMLKAGIAFAITTFFVYFLFMLGIIKIINVLEIAQQVRYIIIGFSFIVGLIMIKDYFFYGKWISLEISSKIKPFLEALTKKGTVFSAIVLATLSSLVELPCTSGLPLAYVSVLSSNNLSPIGYLLLYNLFFVLPLIFIILGVTLTWTKIEKVEKWRQNTKKYMRLISGLLLIAIAIALFFNII